MGSPSSRKNSSSEKTKKFDQNQVFQEEQVRPYKLINPVHKQSKIVKIKIHEAFKTQSLEDLIQLMRNYQVEPHEELSVDGFSFCLLHYAANYKNCQILELLIQISYICYNKQFIELINIQTKSGHSPAMLCVIYKSVECLQLLLDYGGIDLDLRDKKFRTILQLTEQYKSHECKQLLLERSQFKNENGILPLNIQKFSQIPTLSKLYEKSLQQDSTYINNQNFKELFLQKERIPCAICLLNQGNLKYTKCCGQPMHFQCKKAQISRCPYCNYKNFELTTKIQFPERAFELLNTIVNVS